MEIVNNIFLTVGLILLCVAIKDNVKALRGSTIKSKEGVSINSVEGKLGNITFVSLALINVLIIVCIALAGVEAISKADVVTFVVMAVILRLLVSKDYQSNAYLGAEVSNRVILMYNMSNLATNAVLVMPLLFSLVK